MSFLSPSQKEIVDCLAGVVDNVEARMMIGTIGLFANDHQFGILEDEELYLCVDEESRSDYVEAGTEPYSASEIDEAVYLEVPDSVLDNEEALVAWVQRAVDVAGA